MNFSYYFARKITFKNRRAVSRLVVILAVISIALGVAVMEISLGVVHGFERQIREKIIGFGAHIRVMPYGAMESGTGLIEVKAENIRKFKESPGIKSVSTVTSGYALLQSDETLEGISIKGLEQKEDMFFFRQALQSGRLPEPYQQDSLPDLLISRKQADKLLLAPGDKARIYFLLEKPKIRPVRISGIYETGLAEFDALTVVCSADFLRKVYELSPHEAMMYELIVDDFDRLDEITADIREKTEYNQMAYSVKELFPEMFAWLGLQHQNVLFILFLMIVIAVINMSSVLLILILERTQTIGLLKALGAKQKTVQNIFIWNGSFLVLTGMIAGNLLGLGVLGLQYYTGWMKLDQESYFLSEVPVAFVWDQFILINVSLALICSVFLLLPARIISSIRISESLRFD